MPAVSQEELDKLRSDNEKLRDQVAREEAKAAENDADRQREYEATQLLVENARLEGQLASAQQKSKVGASREGASNLMEAAADQLAAAQAALENPQGVPVDVNDPENLKTYKAPKVEEGKIDTGSVPQEQVVVPADVTAKIEKNGGNS